MNEVSYGISVGKETSVTKSWDFPTITSDSEKEKPAKEVAAIEVEGESREIDVLKAR